MTIIKLGVVGYRGFEDKEYLFSQLDKFSPKEIISGGAKGVDTLAVEYAKIKDIPFKEFKPDYKRFPSKVAPIQRNKEIIANSDHVLAVWNGDSPGTRNSIQNAYDTSKPITVKVHGADFSQFDIANKVSRLEIIGDRAAKGEMADLRAFKKDLYNRDLNPLEFKMKIRDLYNGIADKLNLLPKNAILINMPSGSGMNIIPETIFELASKSRPDLTLINSENTPFIKTISKIESKNKTRYDLRINDIKSFEVTNNEAFQLAKKSNSVYILDDILSTGDTATLLARILKTNGIDVKGVIVAKTNEPYLTSKRDMERIFMQMVSSQNPKFLPPSKDLQAMIIDNFAGFPRRKATSFENDLFRNQYLAKEPGLAVSFLAKNASVYRALQIDAGSMLNQQQEQEQITRGPKR